MYIIIIRNWFYPYEEPKLGKYSEDIIFDQIYNSHNDALDGVKDSKFHNEYPNGIYEIYEIKQSGE